jgi:hypothetical protein
MINSRKREDRSFGIREPLAEVIREDDDSLDSCHESGGIAFEKDPNRDLDRSVFNAAKSIQHELLKDGSGSRYTIFVFRSRGLSPNIDSSVGKRTAVCLSPSLS